MKHCECKVQRPDLEADCALCGRPYKDAKPRPDDREIVPVPCPDGKPGCAVLHMGIVKKRREES